MENEPKTFFACPNRMSQEMIDEANKQIALDPIARGILNAVDSFMVILNKDRQIVAANQNFLELLNISQNDLLGKRLGECLKCINAQEAPSGCGTSKKCKYCGAVLSILESFQGKITVADECGILIKNDNGYAAAEFKVRATPLFVGESQFTVVVLTDISGQKRKDALEKVFLHDIANTICGLKGWAELLQECESQEAVDRIVELSKQLVDDVNSQRLLLMAESHEVQLAHTTVSSSYILDLIRTVFSSHDVAIGRTINFCKLEEDVDFTTDMSLFMRVIVNMVKNALEATEPGGLVTVGVTKSLSGLIWCIHNPAFIPDEVAARIFQRSFSTKQTKGRGLGTYSMKLFGETYLNGEVWFETDKADGTNFYFKIK